jgi:hypothetical protein
MPEERGSPAKKKMKNKGIVVSILKVRQLKF